MKNNRIVIALCAGILLFSCQETDENVVPNQQQAEEEIVYSDLRFPPMKVNRVTENARMVESEYQAKLYMAEYIVAPGSTEMGRTVLFDNKGSKKLSIDFAPQSKMYGTPDMSYYIDSYRPASSLAPADSRMAIENSLMTWEGATCSELNLYDIGPAPFPVGIVASILGFPSVEAYGADIENLGFMPGAFFNFLAPGGENSILGVTFTFFWIDENGDPVDQNNDGKPDAAFREIYYNDNFNWAVDGSHIDLETVALHENGHGLSQAHFGTLFQKQKGDFQFSPRAVMNAGYTGIQRTIGKTDLAGHCSIWANWPNK